MPVNTQAPDGAVFDSCNALLCKDCQSWSDINFYTIFWDYISSQTYVALDQVLANKTCLICKAAGIAVLSRLGSTAASSASRVEVYNGGPYFLDYDVGTSEEAVAHRVDTTNPSESVVRLLMQLQVRVYPEALTTPIAPDDEPKEFKITPQLCLRYSRSNNQSYLKSVEPWELPYFNLSLPKKWLAGCTKVHGVECKKSTQAKIGKELPLYPKQCFFNIMLT